MNGEEQVLQAVDRAQAALRLMPALSPTQREQQAHEALAQVAAAPWSMVARASEADQHGWLSQLREALGKIEEEPDAENVEQIADEGLWAADELERDLRGLVGAR